ncbi:hypothetical protein QJS66_00665 [Kocuria rhizophila]|nr:hypothetical protein QJS66_00665 [Kocuria rhizophila]
MYVWLDALTNYLTPGRGFPGHGRAAASCESGASVHLIGKDIARFTRCTGRRS